MSPTLGFLIVVAAGVERIFGRTTEAAVALDRLRRELAREQRMLTAASGPFSLAEDRFAVYARDGLTAQERSGLIGVWRGGVSLLGVAFSGVGFIGCRSPLVMVEVWKVMRAKVRTLCSTFVSAW